MRGNRAVQKNAVLGKLHRGKDWEIRSRPAHCRAWARARVSAQGSIGRFRPAGRQCCLCNPRRSSQSSNFTSSSARRSPIEPRGRRARAPPSFARDAAPHDSARPNRGSHCRRTISRRSRAQSTTGEPATTAETRGAVPPRGARSFWSAKALSELLKAPAWARRRRRSGAAHSRPASARPHRPAGTRRRLRSQHRNERFPTAGGSIASGLPDSRRGRGPM
jgi:hypothetical protein